MNDDVMHPAPFDTLERAFNILCAGPAPLALEAGAVAGLPQRSIPLDELQGLLLHPSTDHHTRDAVLGVLVARARADGGRWRVGLAGVLLPGLRRAVLALCDVCPGKAADIEAEALLGLLEGIAATDPGRSRLAARLTWLARNRAKRLVVRELAEARPLGHQAVSQVPARPYGHPDLILAKAVHEGVLCMEDAALIGDTRLGELSVADAAAALGIAPKAAYKRRDRAEEHLVAWLTGGYDPGLGSFVEKRPRRPYLGDGGRPRQGRALDRPSAACQPPTEPRR